MHLMVVDLPAPLGPMKASISPRSTLNETSSTAWTVRRGGEKMSAITRPGRLPSGGFSRAVKLFRRCRTLSTISMAHSIEERECAQWKQPVP